MAERKGLSRFIPRLGRVKQAENSQAQRSEEPVAPNTSVSRELRVSTQPSVKDAQVNLRRPEDIRQYMAGARSAADWNARCDAVIAANDGKYPASWYPTVVASGLAAETSSNWGKEDK